MTGLRTSVLGLAVAALTLVLAGCTFVSDGPPTPSPVASVPSSVATLGPPEEVHTEPVLDPTCREVDADNLQRATDLVTVYWGGKIAKSAMVDAGADYLVIAVKITGVIKDDYGTSRHSERDRATFVSRAREDGSTWFTEIADGWVDLRTGQAARAAALDCVGG